MSPTGFRWFVCGVVAALVVIMLIVLRTNAAWDGRTPAPDGGTIGAQSGATAPDPI